MHSHIAYFNPDVITAEESYQDFFDEIKEFDAGCENKNFSEFIVEDSEEYRKSGNGVTYIVWNVFVDDNQIETGREVVAYYTLATTSIPYEDRIRKDEDEILEDGEEFDIQICGISAIEIKMFAVNEKYQDTFYEFEGEDLPVAAWIMRSIINYADNLSNSVLGFKAILLHSVPEAEEFYKTNGFHFVEANMKPLHNLDSEYKAMYLTLRKVHMNYDE